MININLLKKKPSPKPKKPHKKIPALNRTKIYFFAFIAVLAFAVYVYMEDIVNYFYSPPPPPIALIPKPIPVDTTLPETAIVIDTPAPEPEPLPYEPEPAPPPEPEPVQKEPPALLPAPEAPKPQIAFSDEGVSITRQVDAYIAMRNALQPDGNYSLLAVEGNRFISEIIASSQETLVKFNNSLKEQLPGSSPRVFTQQNTDQQSGRKVIVWGNYWTGEPESRGDLPSLLVDEIVRKMWRLARQKGFELIAKEVGSSFSGNDGKTRIPLVLKFTGSERETVSFLTAFKREPLNVQLQKIAGMPRGITDKGTPPSLIQLVLQLYVILQG